MKNYLVVNKYLQIKSFDNLRENLKKSFEFFGEELEIITNDKALEVFKNEGKGQPVLFFDKDIKLAKILEKRGYRLINSSFTIETCDDKAKTFVELFGKVEMPKTVIPPFTFSNVGYSDYEFLKDVERKLSYPIVVKESCGSFGKGVYLASDYDELLKIVKNINSSDIIFQEFIESSKGRDLRVYVVNGKAVAWGLRENSSDFRSNVEIGGKMSPFNPPESYLEIAQKAISILKGDFGGVDVLFGKDGPLICEVNSNALFNALSLISEIDVGREIAKYYLSIKK